MAVTDIDVGTVANDGTGQTLRAAFQRVNTNTNTYFSITCQTLTVKQADITPAGTTPTNAEIASALVTDDEDSAQCIFILKDLTNSVCWWCLSDGTDWHIVQMSKIS
jgi:hypothetical protein